MSSSRLTQLSNCAGCAAKIRPDLLSKMLSGLKRGTPPRNVLVGYETNDDAAVVKLNARQAIVETVDFFPPVVDEPFAYGQIAAANAMSDIWAMGAKALFALNVVAFPKDQPLDVLQEILAGGQQKATEAGIPILGGHSVQSPEPKYGMAVTGIVHPARVLTNRGGRPGDVLLLTKPIGTGIATTAIKRGLASASLTSKVTLQMASLNKAAGEVLAQTSLQVHALTDVTGFGLLGHLGEMVRGAKLRAVLHHSQVPVLPEVVDLALADVIPGGTRTNLEHAARFVRFPPQFPVHLQQLLADAQTNGGLLAALPEKHLKRALAKLEQAGVQAFAIGCLESGKPRIDVA